MTSGPELTTTPSTAAARRSAALQVLGATVLWATSFVLVKHAMVWVGAATLVGLRYLLAAALLLAYGLLVDRRRPRRLPWTALILIGVLQYGVGQAMQYNALRVLPATTIALLLGLLPILLAVADTVWLREPPGALQLLGAAVTVGGIALYLPWQAGLAWRGLLLMAGTLITVTVATALSRLVAREGGTPTLYLTMVSMAAGAAAILPAGLILEPAPRFPLSVIGALIWLAVLNTAVAFSIWNHALRTLTTFEVNVIGNATLFEVGVLGWLLLGETLTARQVLGMVIAAGGVLLVQLRNLSRGRQRRGLAEAGGRALPSEQ